MNFRTRNICPSLAQFAPFLLLCILFLSPALTWAASDSLDNIPYFVLTTELPEVRDSLLNANIDLPKQAGVDGFRLDTFKHFETDFWLEQGHHTRAEISKDFLLLAEYWGGTASSLDPFFAQGEVDAGFDFSFKGGCEAFVNGRGRAVACVSQVL